MRSRLVAALSVAVMIVSASVLVTALRAPADLQPRREWSGPHLAQSPQPSHPSRRDCDGPAAALQSRREGGAWREVLAALDLLRARAYAESDARLLRAVYTPRSRVLRVDRALLRRYHRRGVRVTGLRMRVIGLHVVERRGRHVVLRVREQVSGGVAISAGVRRMLSADEPETRLITLHRDHGAGWRIAAVGPP
ncbi:MAG: hypothetical protein ACRDOJ_07580 [Nocardioidaceae bacterium]